MHRQRCYHFHIGDIRPHQDRQLAALYSPRGSDKYYQIRSADKTINNIGGAAGGGAEGGVALTCRQGGKRYQMPPPPFRRLSAIIIIIIIPMTIFIVLSS